MIFNPQAYKLVKNYYY